MELFLQIVDAPQYTLSKPPYVLPRVPGVVGFCFTRDVLRLLFLDVVLDHEVSYTYLHTQPAAHAALGAYSYCMDVVGVVECAWKVDTA